MRLIYKICLINMAIVFAIALFVTIINESDINIFFFAFGLTGLALATIALLTSLVLFGLKRPEWAKGFLLSSGVLFLLSAVACSTVQY